MYKDYSLLQVESKIKLYFLIKSISPLKYWILTLTLAEVVY